MFKKLDISNFGIYKDFEWKDNVKNRGNQEEFFKKLNIIYGRNYSGKTTVSRIFRILENGELPEKLDSPNFSLYDYENNDFNQDLNKKQQHTIRVYNKDFVRDNLKWLIDENDGEIKPFAILGEGNLKTENDIESIKKELGNQDEKKGILFYLSLKRKDYNEQFKKIDTSKKSINQKLKSKANDQIKYDFNLPNYNIKTIKDDIRELLKSPANRLSDEEKENKENLLKDNIKDKIDDIPILEIDIESLGNTVIELCGKKITPTKPIQDLLNNALLQNWAQEGINLHKEKRETCGFCQQPLPNDLWEKLSNHFNEESQLLENEIDSHIENLENQISLLQSHIEIDKTDFYRSQHKSIKLSIENWSRDTKKLEVHLNALIEALSKRRKDIFNPFIFKLDKKITRKPLDEELTSINKIIHENNERSLTLNSDQIKARTDLRLDVVNNFLTDIDYSKSLKEIKTGESILDKTKKEVEEFETKTEQKYKEIKKLELELKDEKNGVAKVNEYLSHFFGEKSLSLEAQEKVQENDEMPIYQFVLQRNGKEASNLSEGESSLIAFCYFLAKLEDLETKNKEIIIWLDDPISSLDSNHIFFVFSLIENLITKPKKYKQLFISTHNLDLLKYLKRLTFPYEEITIADNKTKKVPDVNHLIIERSADNSCIKLMPDYLKQYITEFNYLFDQIFKCYTVTESEENFHVFYNFGNNLRKFLEAYLFYKYPNRSGNTERLKQFMGDDTTSTTIIERINNELSHLEEIFDRSMSPIEIPEIKKLATFILKKMCDKDEEQLRALLSSINKKQIEINTIINDLK